MIVKQILVGMPKTVGVKNAANPLDREWTSGIFKEAVTGTVWLSHTNLIGDGQADLKNHGGPEKAVFVYPSEHYSYWHKEHHLGDLKIGSNGENFATEGVTEETMAIGDTFQIGEAVVQVSQPRQPCWKPARRYKIKELALLIQRSGRTGWYFRVLKEGFVEKDQRLQLIDRPCPEWTIARCNEIMHVDKQNIEAAQRLAQCEWLASNWKATLTKRVEKGESPNIHKRVIGPNE